MTQIYVVTEAYGASAVADTFTTWDAAIAYARRRFDGFRSCDCETWSDDEDSGCELAHFSATWDPCSEDPNVARRVDINVWPTKLDAKVG